MRVGTSGAGILKDRLRKDHPHACGDKGQADYMQSWQRGSSPCVWGQVEIAGKKLPKQRIIPMRVGTSYR